MRTVDGGSRAPTFWSFVLATITLSPVEQQRHWLEDTVCLELTRYKDVSIVSISKISEVIVSNCSTLMLWNLQLSNNSFEWKNVTFLGSQNILWPLLHFVQGSGPPTPRIYTPDPHSLIRTDLLAHSYTKKTFMGSTVRDPIHGFKKFRGYNSASRGGLKPWRSSPSTLIQLKVLLYRSSRSWRIFSGIPLDRRSNHNRVNRVESWSKIDVRHPRWFSVFTSCL